MPNTIQTVVTFSEDAQIRVSMGNGPQVLDMLGGEYDVALQLRDLFDAVKEALQGAVDQVSELTIEVKGSLELKGTADTKLLIFNVGGSASNTNTMTVSLKTTIKPDLKE